MTLACEQYRSSLYPTGVTKEKYIGLVCHQVLEPFRTFPRNHAHLLAGGADPSLAHRRRNGKRPLPMPVFIDWLLQSKRVDEVDRARRSLQRLAELIDCDAVPRAFVACRTPAEEIADVSRSAGETLAVFAESMVDAEMDDDEAAVLLESLGELRDEVGEAIAALRSGS